MSLVRKFHPHHFDFGKLEAINSAFIQYTYVEDDKYEMVEAEKVRPKQDESVTYFCNGERISETFFLDKTAHKFKVEKNRLVFLHADSICTFDIYIQADFQIIPVITIEFGNEEEKERYRPLEWFGLEVSDKFYNEKALWQSFQAIKN